MSMDREDFESDEAWKNYLDQQMTQKFSAADFANARFAEHPNPETVDAQYAARMSTNPRYPWLLDGVPGNTDSAMAKTGWVPVPTKPTITSRRYQILMRYENAHYQGGFNDALAEFGIEIVDGPEPTNTDRLKQLIKDYDECDSYISLPEFLDQFGVTAPNVKGN